MSHQPPQTQSAIIDITTAKSHVNKMLEQFFSDNRGKSSALSPYYEQLWRSIETLVMAGGKRFRPYMTMMTYQALGDHPVEDIVSIATAQELLHVALLIHDDVIDRDYVRYGIDNVSGQYNAIYASLVLDDKERRHFSDSAAILAGDLLIAAGFKLINESPLPIEVIRDASDLFNQAIFTVAGGELIDTESAFRPFESIDALTIIKAKTAHYSFVTPIIMGARLAQADDAVISGLTTYAENLGIGYQLVDDLLGVFGSEELTGKSAINDIQESKHTYLVEQFIELANDSQRDVFDRLFGKKDLTESEANTFRDVLIESGAKDRVESAINGYADKARHALESTPLTPQARYAFESLIEKVLRRDQ